MKSELEMCLEDNQMKCERCGNQVLDNKFFYRFKCPKCKDVKIKRKLLKSFVKIVKNNFKKLKEEYEFLENLYAFGCYASKSRKCRSVDLLAIINKLSLKDVVMQWLKQQREEIWKSYTSEKDLDSVVNYLNKNAFFDFRDCQEYPDCLDCYTLEGCSYEKGHWKSQPNYCLLKCRYKKLPLCMNVVEPFCSWDQDSELTEPKRLFLKNLMDQLKNNADNALKVSGLEVKVIRVLYSFSLEEFRQYEELSTVELRLLGC